jgi:hypothetical protein
VEGEDGEASVAEGGKGGGVAHIGADTKRAAATSALARCWFERGGSLVSGGRGSGSARGARAIAEGSRVAPRRGRGGFAEVRSRSGGKDARARRARAHLRILLWGPLLLLDSRVDLVSPSLGALLAGLTGKLGRDERPSVAVNFL